MKYLYVLMLWLSSAMYFVQAQTLTGEVTSAEGKAIPFASVSLLNTNTQTLSDQEGKYTFTLSSGTYQIVVQADGFATQVQTVQINKQSITLNFTLEAATEALDEVVVTATKKEEEATQVPIAVSSLSAEKIEATRTWDLAGLTALVPNYLYQGLGVGFQQIQSIRGVQVFSENPAVATYIDGVNNLDILANGFALTDVARIEVLRGPQGTLFGRNAMGGVVNIITKQPTNETSGFVEVGAGNLALQRHSLGFKTPLVKDKLFFGINGLYQTREGYWENDTTGTGAADGSIVGEIVGDEQNLYGNLFLKWLPSNRFAATLNVKAQRDWSDATGFFVSQPNETIAFENPDKIFLSRIGSHERNIINTALDLKYFAQNFTLTSISAFQSIRLAYEDVDFPGIFNSFRSDEVGELLPPQEVWSQELRINGREDARLRYTAGLYGFTQIGYEPSTNFALESAPNSYVISRNKGDNVGIAAFGEASYNVTEKLTLTAGLRYDYERRESTFNGFGDLLFVEGTLVENQPDTTLEGSYEALSPKAVLAYAFSDYSNAYLSYTRGFRAGGINAQRLPAGIDQTFDPENSDNYEIGYKINTKDSRVRVAAALFLIEWQDLQFFNLVGPNTFARENVGNAQSWGVELQSTFIPENNLLIDLVVGLNETTYEGFQLERADLNTGEIIMTEISGNRLANAPSATFLLGLQYQLDLSDKFNVVARGEARHVGMFFTDVQNTLQQLAYTSLNARLAFNYGQYNLVLWGQNLTDETYLAYGNPDTSSGRSVRTAAPATYGISVGARF
ncbi:MAG: TonB-dependent receptor [Thermonemataceae bacterium]